MSKDEIDQDDDTGDGAVRPSVETRIALGIMTPTELAIALGVHVGTLKQWRYRGVGPDYTVAERRVYYRYLDVQQYLHVNRRAAKDGGAL